MLRARAPLLQEGDAAADPARRDQSIRAPYEALTG
jgi:hypothetical protein